MLLLIDFFAAESKQLTEKQAQLYRLITINLYYQNKQ